jgi:hypothetical protein
MRWQKLRWLLAGLVAVFLLLWIQFVYWPNVLTVSYPDYCRVQQGMSRAAVETVLGGRPTYPKGKDPISQTESFCWDGCAGSADVVFDKGGMVVAKQYLPKTDWDNVDAATRERIRREWQQSISEHRRARALDYFLSIMTLAGLVAFGAGVVVLSPRSSRVTRENYLRIQPGMTRAEVKAILGPPGDYTSGPVASPHGSKADPVTAATVLGVSLDSGNCWADDAGFVVVLFDNQGRVETAVFEPYIRERQGQFDDLL